MNEIRFEWDEAKNRTNQRKHGIGFEEASRVFLDPFHLSMQDRIEDGEPRWRTIGTIEGLVVLVVAHVLTEADENGTPVEIVRIISARRATRRERLHYEQDR
ncbi:MAG: membrane protein [Alphaproteobacteria bacterium]|nr:MAG: membrane protein [Alphaproteobacteria bacterium]